MLSNRPTSSNATTHPLLPLLTRIARADKKNEIKWDKRNDGVVTLGQHTPHIQLWDWLGLSDATDAMDVARNSFSFPQRSRLLRRIGCMTDWVTASERNERVVSEKSLFGGSARQYRDRGRVGQKLVSEDTSCTLPVLVLVVCNNHLFSQPFRRWINTFSECIWLETLHSHTVTHRCWCNCLKGSGKWSWSSTGTVLFSSENYIQFVACPRVRFVPFRRMRWVTFVQ